MRRSLLAAALMLAALGTAAPAAAAEPKSVSIDVNLILSGNLQASTTAGTFSVSGAIPDAGTESGAGWFAGLGHLKTGDPNVLHTSMTLVGALGTVTLDLVGQFGPLPAPLAWGDGRWVITGGTGAYADVHGRGSWTAVADFRAAFAMTGPPTVAFDLTGSTN